MFQTPQQIADYLSSCGAKVRHDPNIVGRAWVHASYGDRYITAVYYLASDPPEVDGPGSGQFSGGHSTPSPYGPGALFHDDVIALVNALQLPAASPR